MTRSADHAHAIAQGSIHLLARVADFADSFSGRVVGMLSGFAGRAIFLLRLQIKCILWTILALV
jgi:hypothetical protein